MSWERIKDVYAFSPPDVSATDQAVLVALAFRTNKYDERCYPGQNDLVRQTHLSRSSVNEALNRLRERGLLQWETGGRKGKRGKGGKVLANSYKICLPYSAPPKKKETAGNPATQEPVSYAQPAPGYEQPRPAAQTPVSASRTTLCPPAGQPCVRQPVTPVSASRTPTEIRTEIDNRNTNRKGGASESGFSSAIDGVLESYGVTPPPSAEQRQKIQQQRAIEISPAKKAVEILGLTPGSKEYTDNYRSYVSVMNQIGDISLCWEIVLQFESKLKQGEGKTMKNRAAVLMSCLKKVLALKPC